MMITQSLYDRLNYLATLKRITTPDARELESAIRLYINPRYTVCHRCVQQLKHGQRMLLNYLSQTEVIEQLPKVVDETLMDEIIPFAGEPDVDIVEAEKVGCAKCKSKRKTKA
jgi:hypothetical protein